MLLGAMSSFTITTAEPTMLPRLHALNQAATPGVSDVTIETLGRLIADSAPTFVACEPAGASPCRPVGFLLLLGPGARHDSPNYAWFAARATETGAAIAYVDRIAVDPALRGSGVGALLYEAAFERCRGRYDRIGCEVNSAPPNPGSMRFHQRLGFHEVGRQDFVPGEKAVVYLERDLPARDLAAPATTAAG